MIYCYMLENTRTDIYIDNEPLIKQLRDRVDTENIYIDPIDSTERAELQQLIKNVLKSFDTLIVLSISTLSNNFKDLLNAMEYLNNMNVEVISVMEPYYSYERYYLPLKDFISIDTIWKSVKRAKGIEHAKAEKRMGRKKDTVKIADAIKLYESGEFKIEDIKRIVGISTSTLYREIRKLNDKN